jgi:hypothetical protein
VTWSMGGKGTWLVGGRHTHLTIAPVMRPAPAARWHQQAPEKACRYAARSPGYRVIRELALSK